MADLPSNDAGAAMNDHVHLCQTPDVASRLRDLGYVAYPWKTDGHPSRYAGKSLILVGAHGCPAGALDIALISQVAADAGARAVRVLEYPAAPYIGPGFDLSRKSLPHDLLARRIVEAAADQEPLRRRVPDILELDIATQFSGEPPAQRWLVGGPEGDGGLLPDAAPILLAGRGGIGKTRAATELAFLTGTWDGRAPAPRWWGQAIGKAGPSVVITYEEHVDTMHRTIHALCRHHGIDLEQGRRRVIVMSMIDPRISGEPLIAPHPKTKALAPTAEYNRLTRQLRKLREHHGELGVIVLDHAIRAFPVDTNAVTDANVAMGLMGRWAGEFDCGVVTLAHTKKVVIHARMGDEEILQAVVGSTGWVSSVRATMVMWQLEEEREAEIAEALDDREFHRGITRRRYVHAQVLKHNVDGLHEGRLTLRRNGAGFDDVSDGIRRKLAARRDKETTAFVKAIGRQWELGTPMQKSGAHGVHENRERLGEPWCKMSKAKLRGLVGAAEKAGLLSVAASHPSRPRAKQAAWLQEDDGAGAAELHAEMMARAIRLAWEARRPFARGEGEMGLAARRHELPSGLQALADDELGAVADMMLMTGPIEATRAHPSGEDGDVSYYRPKDAAL